MKEGELAGYWEWLRKDGTRMRSAYFENGNQVGEWTTYDAKGKIVKVTKMKSPVDRSSVLVAGRVRSPPKRSSCPVSICEVFTAGRTAPVDAYEPPVIAGQCADFVMQRKARAQASPSAPRIQQRDPAAFFG
jgi:hypothetical protein